VNAPPGPEELRLRAERVLLAQQAPEALCRALRHARLRLERDVEDWDTSTGHTRAHRLGFGTDASSLAILRYAPSSFELLCDAFASALALDVGQTLFDLRPYWALGAAPRTAGPYRGESFWPEADRDDDEALRAAALAYLDVVGDEAARRWLVGATLRLQPEDEGIRVDAEGRGHIDTRVLAHALTDLLQGFEGRPVVVRLASR
jgi:hypothetical protein